MNKYLVLVICVIMLLLGLTGCAYQDESSSSLMAKELVNVSKVLIFEDLRFPAVSVKTKAGSAKEAKIVEFRPNTIALEFLGSSDREAYISFQLPHERLDNTTIFPHFHWSPEDTTSGSVNWCIDISCSNINDIFPTTTTYCVDDVSDETLWKHQMTNMIVVHNNLGASAMCSLRLWRNSSDSYSGSAYLHEFDVHYIKYGID